MWGVRVRMCISEEKSWACLCEKSIFSTTGPQMVQQPMRSPLSPALRKADHGKNTHGDLQHVSHVQSEKNKIKWHDAWRNVVSSSVAPTWGLWINYRSIQHFLSSDLHHHHLNSWFLPLFSFPFFFYLKRRVLCRKHPRKSTQNAHSCPCVPPQRPLPSCCHVIAQALATVSERANKIREILARAQERGNGKKRKRSCGPLISDESNSVNCC